jgi:hypothetical protein
MFTPVEDQRLLALHKIMGSDWKLISAAMGTRNARQCRERYRNYLNPKRTSKAWGKNEDELILRKYREIGMQWAAMAHQLPGRTPVDIRNRWTVLYRRELSTGEYLVGHNVTPADIDTFGNIFNPFEDEAARFDGLSRLLDFAFV